MAFHQEKFFQSRLLRLVDPFITTDGVLRGMKQCMRSKTIIDEDLVEKVKDFVDSKVLEKQSVSVADFGIALQISQL